MRKILLTGPMEESEKQFVIRWESNTKYLFGRNESKIKGLCQKYKFIKGSFIYTI